MRQGTSFLCLLTVLFWTVVGVLPHHHHHHGEVPCLFSPSFEHRHPGTGCVSLCDAHGHTHEVRHCTCDHTCDHSCPNHDHSCDCHAGSHAGHGCASDTCHEDCTTPIFVFSPTLHAPEKSCGPLPSGEGSFLLLHHLIHAELRLQAQARTLHFVPLVLGKICLPHLLGQGLRAPPTLF